jgi:hypothetical protein
MTGQTVKRSRCYQAATGRVGSVRSGSENVLRQSVFLLLFFATAGLLDVYVFVYVRFSCP